jgi:Flp pilus assembly protein TadD
LSADAFSNEWETFDLLGTAYMQDGNNALAVENFTKSLDLNPENTNASEMLKKLKKS